MRVLISIIIGFSFLGCASISKYPLKTFSYSPQDLQLPPPSSEGKAVTLENKTYLSMDLPYVAFEKLRTEIEGALGQKLLNRGEAHITVVTPPEFKRLQNKISMKDILGVAQKMNLEKSPYRPLCVGQGVLKGSNPQEATYYVVIESDRLFEIRKEIQSLFLSKGGKSEDFSAENFYPHVTLGYTKRDLHFEDGVVKDASSCIFSLRPQPETKN